MLLERVCVGSNLLPKVVVMEKPKETSKLAPNFVAWLLGLALGGGETLNRLTKTSMSTNLDGAGELQVTRFLLSWVLTYSSKLKRKKWK